MPKKQNPSAADALASATQTEGSDTNQVQHEQKASLRRAPRRWPVLNDHDVACWACGVRRGRGDASQQTMSSPHIIAKKRYYRFEWRCNSIRACNFPPCTPHTKGEQRQTTPPFIGYAPFCYDCGADVEEVRKVWVDRDTGTATATRPAAACVGEWYCVKCHPGWEAATPTKDLRRAYAARARTPVERINDAMQGASESLDELAAILDRRLPPARPTEIQQPPVVALALPLSARREEDKQARPVPPDARLAFETGRIYGQQEAKQANELDDCDLLCTLIAFSHLADELTRKVTLRVAVTGRLAEDTTTFLSTLNKCSNETMQAVKRGRYPGFFTLGEYAHRLTLEGHQSLHHRWNMTPLLERMVTAMRGPS